MISHELWKIHYSRKNVTTLSGKKRKHILNIIGTFCLCGVNTTTTSAKFSLFKYDKKSKMNHNEIHSIDHRYDELINGKAKKRSGKKKSNLLYPGLIKENILIKLPKIINSKNNPARQYFISFKGTFFGLGYDFSEKEFDQFLETASQINIFFAYVKKIKNETSFTFFKELFIKPSVYLIKKGKFIPDDDIYLSFNLLADFYGFELHKMIKACHDDFSSKYMKKYKLKLKKEELLKNIEKLLENNWYSGIDNLSWYQNMVQLYYPDPKSQNFYSKYCDDKDQLLLFKTMHSIHQSYYETFDVVPPSKHIQELII